MEFKLQFVANSLLNRLLHYFFHLTIILVVLLARYIKLASDLTVQSLGFHILIRLVPRRISDTNVYLHSKTFKYALHHILLKQLLVPIKHHQIDFRLKKERIFISYRIHLQNCYQPNGLKENLRSLHVVPRMALVIVTRTIVSTQLLSGNGQIDKQSAGQCTGIAALTSFDYSTSTHTYSGKEISYQLKFKKKTGQMKGSLPPDFI